jgi:hypothetical protein
MPLGTTPTCSVYWEFDMRRPWREVLLRHSLGVLAGRTEVVANRVAENNPEFEMSLLTRLLSHCQGRG